jgi:hypothetical protein
MLTRLRATRLNAEGSTKHDAGDIAGAEASYRAAMALAPDWVAPAYNLGLLLKYQARWDASFECNAIAVRLDPANEGAQWNLGIAATALGRWAEARAAWTACGIEVPAGDGPPEFNWGMTPVRLNPETDGEVVWSQRLDPARARLLSIPLPESPFRWGDIVLTDGAEEGQRILDGRVYPVFNVLDRLVASPARTFIIELATGDADAISALQDIADEEGGAAEDWRRTTHRICRACSLGLPDGHVHEDDEDPSLHCGLAAPSDADAERIITRWMASHPMADVVRWYAAPAQGC